MPKHYNLQYEHSGDALPDGLQGRAMSSMTLSILTSITCLAESHGC